MGECIQGIWDSMTNCMKGVMIIAPKFPDALVHRVFFVMQAYLTNGWGISFTHAAAIMNFWEGMSLVLPVLFQLLADTVVGNFTVAVISSVFSAVGIGMVALSVPRIFDHYNGTCPRREAYACLDGSQEAVFFAGMVLTALGRAGISFSLDALLDEQQSNASGTTKCRWLWSATTKYIRFAVWIDKLFLYAIGSLIVFIFVVCIKKWKLLFGIPAIYSAYMTVVFLCGCCWYKRRRPEGSPLTSVCRILYTAATLRNRSEPLISHEDDQKPFFDRFPRCLDKVLPAEHRRPDNIRTFDPERVEIARFVVGMIPISITFIFCGVVSSIGNTYFLEQANHMQRRVGSWNVPLLALLLPVLYFKLCHDLYMWGLFKIKDSIRQCIKMEFSLVGISMAMIYSVLCCITAARMEEKRLGVVEKHHLFDKPDNVQVPMHAAWLLFQFFLLAGLDACLRISVEEFYKDHAPTKLKAELEKDEAAKRYLVVAVEFVSGLGFLASVLSVYVVGRFSNWFQYTLNKSRLDRYYWLLAGLSAVNYVAFLLISSGYMPKPPKATEVQGV